MSLKAITAALGGDLYEGGRRANIPAPGHSPADRSVSLLLSGDRIVVHAFNGVDWRDVLDELRRHGLIDERNMPKSAGATLPGWSAPARPSGAERTRVARSLWSEGKPVCGTLSERYLRLRHVTRRIPCDEVLRHHHRAPIAAYSGGAGRREQAALMAAVRDGEGELAAVEITYLEPSGRRASKLRLPRKTIGVVPGGSAIRLDAAAPEMLVAEGLLTTLSASEVFGLPGWALMSTSSMRCWNAPEAVRSVLIAADRGPDGEASAGVLADRLRRRGVRVRVCAPGEPHGDWNDAAAAAAYAHSAAARGAVGLKEGERAREGAPKGQDDPRPRRGSSSNVQDCCNRRRPPLRGAWRPPG